MKHGIIEARGLSLDGKRWRKGELVHNWRKGEKGLCPFITEWVHEWTEIPGMAGMTFEESFPVQAGTIGVCSGLRDKDNKLLYGGDLIEYKDRNNRLGIYPLQYFSKLGIWGLYTERIDHYQPEGPLGHGGSSTRYRPYVLDEYHQKRMRLIGNVHQNKELNPYYIKPDPNEELPF